MTVPEQVGKVASEAVAGLKTSPSCLAAIILAALFSVLVYIAGQREGERAQARLQQTMALLERCLDENGSGK